MDKLQYSNLLHIKEASEQGRLVVFVGAGVSNNSGVPTWSKLINDMKASCGADNETDELKIAQLYKDARGEKEYMDKVKEVLKYNKVSPNPIHKAILDLNPCHIITTNYDNLLELEIDREFKQFDIIREDKDIPNISYPNSLIKMHGDFGKNNIVLTENDYYNYNKNFPLIRSFVLSLFASKLVVFIGFSFADLNLKKILSDLRSVLHESMQRVYLISDTKPSQIINTYYENKGINVVYLDESDLSELYSEENDDIIRLTNPKGVYLYKVIKSLDNITKEKENDLVNLLYSQLVEIKDELAVVGDGLKYLFPKKDRQKYSTHSQGLQLFLPYFSSLQKQFKTFAGKRRFVLDHPNINWKELKQLAFINHVYEIDDVVIVDYRKQYELNLKKGRFSTLWYYYCFDYNNLQKLLLELNARELTGDSKDLEYPFILYKLGDYYKAYKEYNRILPLAWERKKYIIYFICLYNLWSIRYGVYAALIREDGKLAKKLQEKLSDIKLDEVLGRLPIPEGIRKTLHDILSYRFLGETTVDTEVKKELIFQQRKSSEKGGCSLNSNISSLLAKYERTFSFCNYNYIICDNNTFYQSIAYNTVCGILNSYATLDTKIDGLSIMQSKIDKISAFCLLVLTFSIEPKKLKDVFRRYEINSIELTDNAIDNLNNYWRNLVEANNDPFADKYRLGNYLENLMYITSKVCNEGIDADNIYTAIIKYWNYIIDLKVHGESLYLLLSKREPSQKCLISLLDKLISTHNGDDYLGSCYSWIAHYLGRQNAKYEFDTSKLQDFTFASDIFHLYKILDSSIQKEFSIYCQKYLHELSDYLDFIVSNDLDNIDIDYFKKRISEIKKAPLCDQGWDCSKLAKMRSKEQYSEVHHIIDDFSNECECMAFFLNPFEYGKKENVDAQWLIATDNLSKLAEIKEYKDILKKYLDNHPFNSHQIRMKIVNAL